MHTAVLCSLLLVDLNTNMKQEEFNEHPVCFTLTSTLLNIEGESISFKPLEAFDDWPLQIMRLHFYSFYIAVLLFIHMPFDFLEGKQKL